MRRLIRILPFVALLLPAVVWAQGGGTHYYFTESARLAEKKALDLFFGVSMGSMERALPTLTDAGEPIRLAGPTSFRDLRWTLRYGLTPWLEGSVRGGILSDANSGASRYGATDTRASLKFGTARPYSGSNFAVEVFYQMPTGFNEGIRLARQFSGDTWAVGGNVFLDFNFNRLDMTFNGGYNHNGGTIDVLPRPQDAFWYYGLDQLLGISDEGKFISTGQYRVGLAAQYRLLGSLRLFSEYHTNRLRAKQNGPLSVGKIALGLTFGDQRKTNFRLGMLRPTGTVSGAGQMGPSLFFDVRFNGLFGLTRRGVGPIPPVRPGTIPAVLPGSRPFYRRDNTYFARTRTPREDTVILVDISPSMSGRGMLDITGDNVLQDMPTFAYGIVDSLREGSNLAIIYYAGDVSTWVWSDVNDEKKQEIRNSINDIPDIATALIQQYESAAGAAMRKENYAGALDRAYQELTNFRAGDYNRIHLQRIIHITDDIPDEPRPAATGTKVADELIRKFNINRNDFRYYYYLMVNEEQGRRPDEFVNALVEREDGKIIGEVNYGNQSEYLARLQFNDVADKPVFKYLSQLSRIAILPFNTNNLHSIRQNLTNAFRSVFDFNEYFVITEDAEVSRVLQIMNMRPGMDVDRSEAMRFGRKLGVDFVVKGEVTDFNVRRDKGMNVPYVINKPLTTVQIKVAVEVIDVADGAVVLADIYDAESSMAREWAYFSGDPESRIDVLSALQESSVLTELLQKWAQTVRQNMFQDVLSMN